MKATLIKSLIPVFFVLLSSKAFAGYWRCENTFIVGDDCLLTVVYEVWWNDETGEIENESSSSSCDCCSVSGGPGKAFVGERISGTEGYESSNFTLTNTGTPVLSQEDMAELWDEYIGPWMETLDYSDPSTCEE